MKIDWPGERCVLCLEKRGLCEEHLIPRALGGILTCRFLCRTCNSRFGGDVEALAKSDPSVLLAVRQLQGHIPELSRRLIEDHPHLATGAGPGSSGYIRDGSFRVSSHVENDGSLILPTDEARKAITTILRRDGLGETPIRRAVETFEGMAENRRTSIALGLDVVKWSVEGIELDLSRSHLIDPLMPAKIAFEFLALCGGEAVCTHDWPLPEVRRILRTGTHWDHRILRVERLHAGDAQPFHGICNEDNSEYSEIQVRLFGCLAYRVHFPQLHVVGRRCAYTHWLSTGKEDVRIIGGDPASST